MKLITRITVSLIGAAAFTLLCLLPLYTAQAIVIAKTRDATKPIVETYLQPTISELVSACARPHPGSLSSRRSGLGILSNLELCLRAKEANVTSPGAGEDTLLTRWSLFFQAENFQDRFAVASLVSSSAGRRRL
jgi:hypothetical protein